MSKKQEIDRLIDKVKHLELRHRLDIRKIKELEKRLNIIQSSLKVLSND